LLELVRQLTLLQVDLTPAVAPSADLVVWSRLGSGGVLPTVGAVKPGPRSVTWQ
jgi:hypothetical protein